MEHINVTQLADGYVRLRPEAGYKLFSVSLNRTVSEAVVKEESMYNFKAIAVNP